MSDVQKAVITQPKSKLDVYKDKFGRYALVTGVAMSTGISNCDDDYRLVGCCRFYWYGGTYRLCNCQSL